MSQLLATLPSTQDSFPARNEGDFEANRPVSPSLKALSAAFTQLRDEVLKQSSESLKFLRSLKKDQQHLFLINPQPESKKEQISNVLSENWMWPDYEPLDLNCPNNVSLSFCRYLDSGIAAFELLQELVEYVELVESEKQRLRYQARRLNQETVWLRKELSDVQHKFLDSEARLVELEVRLQHETFLKELATRQETTECSATSANNSTSSTTNPSTHLNFTRSQSRNENSNLSAGILKEIEAMTSDATTNGNPEIPSRLRTLHNLVIQYAAQGRFEVAVPLCKQALDDLQSNSGYEHPDVATMLNILALVYRDQGKFRESEMLLTDALEIREKTLGENHPSVASTLNNLAVLFGKRSKYREAEPLCKRALEIREKVLGPEHPDVAKQLNNLALLCQNQGKYDEVEEYYKRALNIYEKKENELDSLNIAKTKNNLAASYLKQNKFSEAEALYKQVLSQAADQENAGQPETARPAVWQLAEEQLVDDPESAAVDPGPPAGQRLSNSRSLTSFSESFHSPCLDSGGAQQPITALGRGSTNISGLDVSTLHSCVRNLAVVYRRTNRLPAALYLEASLPSGAGGGVGAGGSAATSAAGSRQDLAGGGAGSGGGGGAALSSVPTQYQSQPQLHRSSLIGGGGGGTNEIGLTDGRFNPRSDYFAAKQQIGKSREIVGSQRSHLPTSQQHRASTTNSTLQQITERFTTRFGNSPTQTRLAASLAPNVPVNSGGISTSDSESNNQSNSNKIESAGENLSQ